MAFPTRSKVSPIHSEYGVSSSEYGGGKISRYHQDEEFSSPLKQEKTILEQARYANMQGKTKPVSSAGKLEKQSMLIEDESMNEMREFIKQNFKQKECCRFVPVPNQEVKMTQELKCRCGEVFTGHRNKNHNMSPVPSSMSREHDHLIPNELQDIMADKNLDKPPPKDLPSLQWNIKEDIHVHATCTFGKIIFFNLEHNGETKPAKYIRLSNKDKVNKALELMKKYWQIMDPRPPNLVISVVGGAKNFKLDSRMRDTFNNGLIRAAKTTNAWLITSGFNMGVMKFVGQAVQQGQSFSWDSDHMNHLLRCIGIAPWGYVKDRHLLEGENDGKGKFPACIQTSNVIEHGKAVPLNPDHTHFIFVDDGFRNRYEGVALFRAELEQKIKAPESANGLEVPLVLVVVEGGIQAINHVHTSLRHGIPVVICSGTGRAADIIAYAYSHTKTEKNKRVMNPRHEKVLRDKILKAYQDYLKPNAAEGQNKVKEVLKKVKECCEKEELITIFHMNKHEALDLSILWALLKVKECENPNTADSSSTTMTGSRLNQLGLALTWNRVDIAQEEIFQEDVSWSPRSLDKIMTRAIQDDKDQFVRLLIQQGVFMKEYLTKKKLFELYNMDDILDPSMMNVLQRLMGKKFLSNCEDTLPKLLNIMLDKYKWEMEDEEKDQFKRPYKELFLWAILYHRQALAKLCWELGEEPVTTAIAATRIYDFLSQRCPKHESNIKEKITAHKNEFENLATSVLDACYNADPDAAIFLVKRKSPSWDSVACIQMAASANDQKFLSSHACQNSIGTQWRKDIISPWQLVLLATLFPPMVYFLEIATASEKTVNCFQKMVIFFTSPISKFSYGAIMYLFFIILFTYLILVDFTAHVITPIEIVCMIWILAYIVDDVHTFICFPSPTLRGKIRDWYSVLKVLDLLNFILALVGFIIHITSRDSFMNVKAIYCVNCIIFCVRVLKLYIANATLGPKLIMIKRMLEELRLFIMVLVVFLLGYGIASQGLLYTQRKRDWEILKDVFYYPYWQLFGEIYLEETTGTDDACVSLYHDTTNTTGGITPCRTSHWLVPILLACYLLVGNVLLLNLLIAIFSHVFDTVEKNSIEIWKYQMYFLSMEYKNKTFLVPPFSIISHILLIFAWIYRWIRRKCTTKLKNKDDEAYLQYLQLFEKEMMANYLRNQKAMETTAMERKVSELMQKRDDEMKKYFKEEMFADHQDSDVKGEAKSEQSGEEKHKIDLQTRTETHSAKEEEPPVRKRNRERKRKRKDKDKENERGEKVEDPDAPYESKLNNVNMETRACKEPELKQKNVFAEEISSFTSPERKTESEKKYFFSKSRMQNLRYQRPMKELSILKLDSEDGGKPVVAQSPKVNRRRDITLDSDEDNLSRMDQSSVIKISVESELSDSGEEAPSFQARRRHKEEKKKQRYAMESD